jgi:hypothetical protein
VRDSLRRAIRHAGEAARGYIRAADCYERALELLPRAEADEREAGSLCDLVEIIACDRRVAGPFGIGARVAVTVAQLEALRVAAQDARAEALAVELGGGAEA